MIMTQEMKLVTGYQLKGWRQKYQVGRVSQSKHSKRARTGSAALSRTKNDADLLVGSSLASINI
jgi:hypothetical protein